MFAEKPIFLVFLEFFGGQRKTNGKSKKGFRHETALFFLVGRFGRATSDHLTLIFFLGGVSIWFSDFCALAT